MLYTDYEWQNSWELNAWPHQLPPTYSDWRSWTVVGGRGTGKTTAGVKWVESKMGIPGAKTLVILHHQKEINRIPKVFWEDLTRAGNPGNWRIQQREVGTGASYVLVGTQSGYKTTVELWTEARVFDGMRGGHNAFDYVWADEITDAVQVEAAFPFVTQFCFTEPVKLSADTIVSRAGKERTLS